jgi:hypothetical protein
MSKIINEFSQALAAIQSSFGRESEEDKLRRQAKVDQLVADDVQWMRTGRDGQAALEELLRCGWHGYDKETESTLDEMLRQRQETAEMIRGLVFGRSED